MAGASYTSEQQVMQDRKEQVDIAQVDVQIAEIKANPELPEWKKKMAIGHLEALKKRQKLASVMRNYNS